MLQDLESDCLCCFLSSEFVSDSFQILPHLLSLRIRPWMQTRSVQGVLNSVLDHVGAMGWDSSCWSDDNLSSKKIYPRFQFPAKSKQWLPRIKTSDESMQLMVRRLHTMFETASTYLRKKPETATVESMAERAAVVVSLAKDPGFVRKSCLHSRLEVDNLMATWP